MTTPRERLVLDPVAADQEVGRWLAALEEVRRDTLAVLADLPDGAVDADIGDAGDTIGTTLYHVALIEIDWVFSDVLDRAADIPGDLFPIDDRVEGGHLSPVTGESLTQHVERLSRTRALILNELRPMSSTDFHEVRARERIDLSASWVVFHLIDHEIEHRVRLAAIRGAVRP